MAVVRERVKRLPLKGVYVFVHDSTAAHSRCSVAEIAKKPLYRVTCGDIGTDAEKVEEVCWSRPIILKCYLTNGSTSKLYSTLARYGIVVSRKILYL